MSPQFSTPLCLYLYHAAVPEREYKVAGGLLGSCQTARSSQPEVGTNDSLMFQIEIPIVNYDTCQEAYAPLKKKVTKDMICAGEKEGKKLTEI